MRRSWSGATSADGNRRWLAPDFDWAAGCQAGAAELLHRWPRRPIAWPLLEHLAGERMWRCAAGRRLCAGFVDPARARGQSLGACSASNSGLQAAEALVGVVVVVALMVRPRGGACGWCGVRYGQGGHDCPPGLQLLDLLRGARRTRVVLGVCWALGGVWSGASRRDAAVGVVSPVSVIAISPRRWLHPGQARNSSASGAWVAGGGTSASDGQAGVIAVRRPGLDTEHRSHRA